MGRSGWTVRAKEDHGRPASRRLEGESLEKHGRTGGLGSAVQGEM